MTGEPDLDFALEAGPRVFGPDLPMRVRAELAHAPSLNWYREALKRMGQEQVAQMHKEIEAVSRDNREIENSQGFKASNGFGYPYYRKPVSVHEHFKGLYGEDCWKEEAFVEDFLQHHPGLRIKVTRGTKGQEYGGRGR